MRSSSWFRRPWPAFLAILIILAALSLQVRFDFLGGLTNGECKTSLCCEDCRSVRVTRIIDGDTFASTEGRVRLYGVDAPERNEACYAQATNRLSNLAGSSVRVQPGDRPTDPNGRWLFYVYTKQGESIDETLIREGLGRAWTQDGQHRDLLVESEQEARRSRTGCLWR